MPLVTGSGRYKMVAIWETTGGNRLEITLIPVPQAAEIARVFVRHKLVCLGYADRIDDACLIVSEMVTNAVRVTATGDRRTQGSIRLRLGAEGGRPLVEVWDSCPALPVLLEPDPLEERGRGLHIIRSLAVRFGWRPEEKGGGKTVWALL